MTEQRCIADRIRALTNDHTFKAKILLPNLDIEYGQLTIKFKSCHDVVLLLLDRPFNCIVELTIHNGKSFIDTITIGNATPIRIRNLLIKRWNIVGLDDCASSIPTIDNVIW